MSQWRQVSAPLATLPAFVQDELMNLIFRKDYPEGMEVGLVIVPETVTVSYMVSSERVTLQASASPAPPMYPDGPIPNIDPIRGYE